MIDIYVLHYNAEEPGKDDEIEVLFNDIELYFTEIEAVSAFKHLCEEWSHDAEEPIVEMVREDLNDHEFLLTCEIGDVSFSGFILKRRVIPHRYTIYGNGAENNYVQ